MNWNRPPPLTLARTADGFLPLLLACYYLNPRSSGYANSLLVVASVLFYAKGGGSFTALMLASIAFNYRMAIAVDQARTTGRDQRMLALAVSIT